MFQKKSCESIEIYMGFDFISRKVVQTNPTHSVQFVECVFIKTCLFSKDLIIGWINWW